MPHPEPSFTPPKRVRPLNAPRLPDTVALRWAARMGELPWGTVRPNPSAALRLREVLISHAAALVPHILGGGTVEGGFLIQEIARPSAPAGGRSSIAHASATQLSGAHTVTVHLPTGTWRTSHGEAGEDVLSLARWAWAEVPGERVEDRLLAHLGLAALDLLAEPGIRIVPREPAPALPARVIPAKAGRVAQAVAWCPWCETVHYHGPQPGNRAPHCALPLSPFRCTGYDLDIQGKAKDAGAVIPDAPAVKADRLLRGSLWQASGALRAVLLRALLGVKRVGATVQTKIAGHSVYVYGDDVWLMEPPGTRRGEGLGFLNARRSPLTEGQGFTGLAAALFGVSRGVAAAHILRAASLDDYDARAMIDIAAAVDAWAARTAKTPHRPC